MYQIFFVFQPSSFASFWSLERNPPRTDNNPSFRRGRSFDQRIRQSPGPALVSLVHLHRIISGFWILVGHFLYHLHHSGYFEFLVLGWWKEWRRRGFGHHSEYRVDWNVPVGYETEYRTRKPDDFCWTCPRIQVRIKNLPSEKNTIELNRPKNCNVFNIFILKFSVKSKASLH